MKKDLCELMYVGDMAPIVETENNIKVLKGEFMKINQEKTKSTFQSYKMNIAEK